MTFFGPDGLDQIFLIKNELWNVECRMYRLISKKRNIKNIELGLDRKKCTP